MLCAGFSFGGFSPRGVRAPGSKGSAAAAPGWAAPRPVRSPRPGWNLCFLYHKLILNQGTTRETRATRGRWVSQASLASGSGEMARAGLTLPLSSIPGEDPGDSTREAPRPAEAKAFGQLRMPAAAAPPASAASSAAGSVRGGSRGGGRSRQTRSSMQLTRGWGAEAQSTGPGRRERARGPQSWPQSLTAKSLLGATLKQQHTAPFWKRHLAVQGDRGRTGPGQTFLEVPGEGQDPRRPSCLAGTACNSSSKPVPGDLLLPRPRSTPGHGAPGAHSPEPLHLARRCPEVQNLGAALLPAPPPTRAGEGASVTDRGPGWD